MSTILKKIKLFDSNGGPRLYKHMNGKLIVPLPRIYMKNTALGLVTSKKLSNAKTKDEHAFLRDIAKYYVMIKEYKEVKKLIRGLRHADRQAVFASWDNKQLIEYIDHFAKYPISLKKELSQRMKRKDLIDISNKVTLA